MTCISDACSNFFSFLFLLFPRISHKSNAGCRLTCDLIFVLLLFGSIPKHPVGPRIPLFFTVSIPLIHYRARWSNFHPREGRISDVHLLCCHVTPPSPWSSQLPAVVSSLSIGVLRLRKYNALLPDFSAMNEFKFLLPPPRILSPSLFSVVCFFLSWSFILRFSAGKPGAYPLPEAFHLKFFRPVKCLSILAPNARKGISPVDLLAVQHEDGTFFDFFRHFLGCVLSAVSFPQRCPAELTFLPTFFLLRPAPFWFSPYFAFADLIWT